MPLGNASMKCDIQYGWMGIIMSDVKRSGNTNRWCHFNTVHPKVSHVHDTEGISFWMTTQNSASVFSCRSSCPRVGKWSLRLGSLQRSLRHCGAFGRFVTGSRSCWMSGWSQAKQCPALDRSNFGFHVLITRQIWLFEVFGVWAL